MFTDPAQLNYLINFDRKTEEIVVLNGWIINLTDSILKKRDEYLKVHGITAKN
jgi:hypothetical protein